MSNKKNSRYKKIRDRVLWGAGSGLVAGIIFMGSANVVLAEGADLNTPYYSQNVPDKGMHVMHRWNSKAKINALANNLGLDQSYIENELKSGKTLKQILLENGVETPALEKAFTGKSRHKSWKKYSISA